MLPRQIWSLYVKLGVINEILQKMLTLTLHPAFQGHSRAIETDMNRSATMTSYWWSIVHESISYGFRDKQ